MTGLWAKNCATIQQVLILKFSFGPEKFQGLLRNGPQASKRAGLEKLEFNFLLALKGWGWEGMGLVSGLNQNLWQHFAVLILAAFCKSEQLTTCLQIECYCSTSTKQINTHLYSNISCSTMFNIVHIWLYDFHIFNVQHVEWPISTINMSRSFTWSRDQAFLHESSRKLGRTREIVLLRLPKRRARQ